MTAIALADGTSLHGECREAFAIARIAQSAEAAVHPALTADPGEVVLCGALEIIEQAFSNE
jgi:dihydrofolate reductase